MRRDRQPVPYQLGYDPDHGILVDGDRDVINSLMNYPGAHLMADLLAVPASRNAVLAVEAMASPEAVSDSYKQMRRELVAVDVSELYASWNDLQVTLARTLLYHQVEFLAFSRHLRGAMNASEQGTGKTACGWLMPHAWQSNRTLIVCPKSLIKEWANEYEALFWERPPIHCFPLGEHDTRTRARAIASFAGEQRRVAIIVNYEAVNRLRDELLAYGADTVIVDESWRIKSPVAQTTQAVMQIADRAEHVLTLTGTPIGNDVGDFYAQMRALDPTFARGRTLRQGYYAFCQRYSSFVAIDIGGRTISKAVGCADPAGLMGRIEPLWYRATKATSLTLPPKRHLPPVLLDMPRDIKDLYDRVNEQGEAALGAIMSLADRRVVMLRLHQLAGGHIPHPRPLTLPSDDAGLLPADLEGEELAGYYRDLGEENGYLPDLVEAAPSLPNGNMAYAWEQEPIPAWPKLVWLQDFAQDRLLGDPTIRVLVWCKYTAEIMMITRELQRILGEHRAVSATGATKEEDLNVYKQSFNSRHPDGVQVMVCQWRKMAAGHNLQAGDFHVRYSHDWSYIYYTQAEDRSDRIGRESSVTYIDLLMRGTIDEEILATLHRKQNLATLFAPDTVGAPLVAAAEST